MKNIFPRIKIMLFEVWSLNTQQKTKDALKKVVQVHSEPKCVYPPQQAEKYLASVMSVHLERGSSHASKILYLTSWETEPKSLVKCLVNSQGRELPIQTCSNFPADLLLHTQVC